MNPPSPTSTPRVAIVDDDPSVSRALVRLVRSAGFEAESFGSAEAFLEASGEDVSDCLILDVQLPGRSGPELQSLLLERETTLPILFISAYGDERVRTQALDSGALAFLEKPLDSEQLLTILRQVLTEG